MGDIILVSVISMFIMILVSMNTSVTVKPETVNIISKKCEKNNGLKYFDVDFVGNLNIKCKDGAKFYIDLDKKDK